MDKHTDKTAPLIVVVNATGAQSSSVVHAASADGFRVRAQTRTSSKPEAKALEALPNVTLVEGSLDDDAFVSTLFKDADYAWVNTTYFQAETEIGKALALAAKNAGVKHYVYSSLGNHSKISNGKWNCPFWSAKYAVEEYIRTLDNFPATFVYVGGYLENYNAGVSVIQIKKQEDGSILMSGKINPDAKLGSLDVERDLGPAVLNILKQGPSKWNQKRVPLAFENVSLKEIAKIFTDATGVKVTYEHTSTELDPANPLDAAIGIANDGISYNWDCKVPDEGRELNPNWHSVEDFAKNRWTIPKA